MQASCSLPSPGSFIFLTAFAAKLSPHVCCPDIR